MLTHTKAHPYTDSGKTTRRLFFMHHVIHVLDPNRYFELFLNQNDFLAIIKLEILLLNNFFDVATKTKIANLPWHLIFHCGKNIT